jgi:hypothetical protein
LRDIGFPADCEIVGGPAARDAIDLPRLMMYHEGRRNPAPGGSKLVEGSAIND